MHIVFIYKAPTWIRNELKEGIVKSEAIDDDADSEEETDSADENSDSDVDDTDNNDQEVFKSSTVKNGMGMWTVQYYVVIHL